MAIPYLKQIKLTVSALGSGIVTEWAGEILILDRAGRTAIFA